MSEIQDAFRQLGDHLESAAAGRTARPEPIVVQGQGMSRDELIEATIEGGRLSALRIHPRAMKHTGEELAEKIAEAVNGALDAHMQALVEITKNPADVSALRKELDDIANQAQRSLDRYMTGMQDVLRQAQSLAQRQEALR